MKYLNFIIISSLFVSSLLAVESDEAKFMAKDTENVLKIVNFKTDLEAKKREEEERKKLLEKQRLEALKKQQLLKSKQNSESDIIEAKRRAALAEQDRLRKEQLAIEEAKRRRVSPVKVVNNRDLDKVSLKKSSDMYYENSYEDLGVPEDTPGSLVSREYIITTDMYIRLLTETNINSRRGGEFVAVVERDVYSIESDTKKVLLPKGSKFVCNFEPLSAYGETALKSTCKRVYFPDGRSIVLSGADLKDQMGRNGIVGKLDNRLWERYGMTFTMAVLSGLSIMTADKMPNNNIGSLSQYTALSVLDLSSQILDKTIDLAPVVSISSGARIILKPEVDINLNPSLKNKTEETE